MIFTTICMPGLYSLMPAHHSDRYFSEANTGCKAIMLDKGAYHVEIHGLCFAETMSLAADLKDEGITVISHCPGW